jgi:hypothetical protein|tara:strand:- start:565 stop:1077 length:513 start_codon:yes stop_codon:yes gene_type:complete
MLVKENPGKRDIEFFGYICEDMGFMNNASLDAMKYNWCLQHEGMWWAVYHDNVIVSMAGCHKFHDGHRMMFRGVQSMVAQGGLGKNHMTSIPWKWILPKQLEWAGSSDTQPAYITTNVENDASGKMNRTDRLFHLLAKQGIVEKFAEEEIYGTLQSVWKLNIRKYYETLV